MGAILGMTSIRVGLKMGVATTEPDALGTTRARQAAMQRLVAAVVGAMLGACALTAAAPAGAQTATETFPKQRRTTKLFYGWEILATGEVGGLLSAASIVLPHRPLSSIPATAGFVLGMPTFALGGPI